MTTTRRGDGGSDHTRLVLAVMLMVLLVPVWLFEYFPSADGPSHLANAVILRDYYFAGSGAYQAYYTVQHTPVPNWFAPLVLAGLVTMLPPLLAEKVLLSGIVLGLPLSMLYVVVGVNRRSAWVALLSLPLVYSYVLYMGFHNFLFSVIFLLLLIGWWWRRRFTLAGRHVLALMGLSLLVYFSHPIGAALAGFVLVGWSVWLVWRHGRRGVARAGWTMLALLPMTALLASFLMSQADAGPAVRMGLVESARRLVTMDVMVSHHLRDLGPALAMACLLAACGAWVLYRRGRGRRAVTSRDAILLTCLGIIAVYFIAPEQTAGGGFITARLVLVVALFVIVWLATGVYPRWWRCTAGTAAVVVTVVMLGMHWPVFERVNDYAQAYAAVQRHLRPGTTLLPLTYAHQGATPDGEQVSRRVRLFEHLAAYSTMHGTVVNLYNYEAKTGYFPIRFHSPVDPFEHLWQRVRPPLIDLDHYHLHTTGTVDYLLIWGNAHERSQPTGRTAWLDGYELIYRCPRYGFIQLYERRSR